MINRATPLDQIVNNSVEADGTVTSNGLDKRESKLRTIESGRGLVVITTSIPCA